MRQLKQPVEGVTLDTFELVNFWDFIDYLAELDKELGYPGFEEQEEKQLQTNLIKQVC